MTLKQLKDTPLHELKRIALEDLKVTKDQVRKYGHLSYRQTWISAILEIRDGIKQLTISDAPPLFSEEPKNPAPKNVGKSHITNDCHIAIDSKKTMPFKAATSNELEVAASNNGFLHQGSKVNSFACPDVADVEATPLDDYLIIEDESSQPTQPEIINITPEEYPEIWEILQPPEPEGKQDNCTINLTTYQVIQSSPEPDLYTFEYSPESPSAVNPKFPLEDFLKALFLGPQALVPNQSA